MTAYQLCQIQFQNLYTENMHVAKSLALFFCKHTFTFIKVEFCALTYLCAFHLWNC